MFRGRVRRVHFIGVGGIGVSGLAEILLRMNFDVSGSDLRADENTRRLEQLGIEVRQGHAAEYVVGADVVVHSSAIAPDNPERLEATRLGIPGISRGEMLAELMRVKYAVAIGGSHGKTTTTSLVATVLRDAGLDPTVVVGGRMAALGSNAHLGAGDLMVAEADESDGSFLGLSPTIAAVTNVDPEHLDFYGSHESLKDAFVSFAQRVPFYGLCVLCVDHPHVRDLLPRISRRHVTYGFSEDATYVASGLSQQGLTSRFAVRQGERDLGVFSLRMPGRHNVLNCLAAIAIADELEVPLEVVKESLSTFGGVARRFTVTAEPRGITLVDDYGHHPAEVRATLSAARKASAGRVWVAFQPHRYTRTQALLGEFSTAFEQADGVFVMDVYAAGEAPIAGVSGETLAAAIRAQGHPAAAYARDREGLVRRLAAEAKPGDIVVALGAGDVNALLPALAMAVEAAAADPGAPGGA